MTKTIIMKKLLFCLSWIVPLQLVSQEFILDKKMDTLFVGEKDTTVNVTFKLKGTELGSDPRLSIKVNSGTAKQGIDFVLLDAYGAKTTDVRVSRVQNGAGSFKILLAGGLAASKSINLQIWINDNGKLSPDIAKIIIAPPTKKTAPEPEKKPETPKNDSLVFEFYNDINVSIYAFETKKSEDNNQKKEPDIEEKRLGRINISTVEIVQRKPLEYQFKITTTENEIYISILELTAEYLYKNNDRLYLLGQQKNNNYIKATDIFLLTVQKKDEKPSVTKNPVYKFKL